MPQRFLRPGIRNSPKWNSVPFEAQSFYIRILTLVDDYGRYDGRTSVLFGECFSVWNDLNPSAASCSNLQQVAGMLQQLAAADLITFGEFEGKKVLQVTQWQERIREGTVPKWGRTPELQQVAATCCNLLPPTPPPPPSPTPVPTPPPSAAATRMGVPDSDKNGSGMLDAVFVRDLMAVYRRAADSRLSHMEESTLAEIVRERPRYRAEWDIIVTLKQKEPRYFPQSLSKLLTNWQETLDRASCWVPDVKPMKSLIEKALEQIP